jgi:hypothetical protein
MLLFSEGNGTMNAPRYWQQRNELLHNNENGPMNSSAKYVCQDLMKVHMSRLSLRVMNFTPALGIHIQISNSRMRWLEL